MWASRQRQSYKGICSDKMTQYRIDLLESIPGWSWDPNSGRDNNWMGNFDKLRGFVELNNRIPSHGSSDKQERDLGRWCNTQRLVYRGSCRGTMTQDKIDLLESIPGWSWDPNSDGWDYSFNKLRSFVGINSRLPNNHSVFLEERLLGLWVCRQRQIYKGNSFGIMSQERIDLLESINFWIWEGDNNFRDYAPIGKNESVSISQILEMTSSKLYNIDLFLKDRLDNGESIEVHHGVADEYNQYKINYNSPAVRRGNNFCSCGYYDLVIIDKKRNISIVIEYDERHHKYEKQNDYHKTCAAINHFKELGFQVSVIRVHDGYWMTDAENYKETVINKICNAFLGDETYKETTAYPEKLGNFEEVPN
jgi:hypothetical protein